MNVLKCKVCGLESSYLSEVTYYDINGNGYYDEQDVERNLGNPDAFTHILCNECAESFNFNVILGVDLSTQMDFTASMTLKRSEGKLELYSVNHVWKNGSKVEVE